MELPDDESDTTEFRGRCPGPAQGVVQGFLRRLYKKDDPAIGERAAREAATLFAPRGSGETARWSFSPPSSEVGQP